MPDPTLLRKPAAESSSGLNPPFEIHILAAESCRRGGSGHGHLGVGKVGK